MAMRNEFLQRLRADLIGPSEDGEALPERPTDRYLSGILWPTRSAISAAEDESLSLNQETPDPEGDADEAVPLRNVIKPASAGISCAVQCELPDPALEIVAEFAFYRQTALESGEIRWLRQPYRVPLNCRVREQGQEYYRTESGLPEGVAVQVLFRPWRGTVTLTATLINERKAKRGATPDEQAASTMFQTRLQITALHGCQLTARPSVTPTTGDDDSASAAVIYRDAREYATGHMCSAEWDASDGTVKFVATTWLPDVIVPATSPDGDAIFGALRSENGRDVLSAEWLGSSSPEQIADGLAMLPSLYSAWLDIEEARIPELDQGLQQQAREHLSRCRSARDRMANAVAYLRTNAAAMNAFRFANEAMRLQRTWTDSRPLKWRPFQLGFVLLALESVADRGHPDRGTMDLLWFPTGGGKTEAYLCLTAFAMAIRRTHKARSSAGDGVAVIMRYTLRLLTIQQFQRAAAMVLACELLRNTGDAKRRFALELGSTAFSIGLWVGGSTTPNRRADVVANPAVGQPDHRQLKACPCCGEPVAWTINTPDACAKARCANRNCPVSNALPFLPLWTVDDDVYREQPSLLIATVDKFAQVVRNADTCALFGTLRLTSPEHAPPELIIQDELHLISGPLGSMAGLYECAIDEICSRSGWRPKVIGSTATIRRAMEQVKMLFWRNTFQFPPPVLNRVNSCFAVQDDAAPGRLYVGVTTAGRSAKFTLQAVCASLMQAAAGAPGTPAERDPYTTLVVYFNSLRELGGALVMMHDDVPRSIEAYALRKNEKVREVKRIGELTSRVSATEIPDILKDLLLSQSQDGHYDASLASNMISVGVDVPRLGLMVVNGQPKNFSEYIQATSRVGRGSVPGLVIGIYNASRNRDRSHYETFRTWHSTLYRAVEATSVTPFAPRAQDKALHAVVVALARHLDPAMLESPRLSIQAAQTLRQFAARVVDRARDLDPDEADAVDDGIARFIDDWLQRSSDLKWYWNDRAYRRSLLISAEVVAALRAARRNQPRAVGTPNSLRDVEPSSQYILLSRKAGGGAGAR
jgi:hypothetical protein